MDETEPTMTNLFLQLGLAADAPSIAGFIARHQLPADVRISEAPYWNDGQRQFLAEQLGADANAASTRCTCAAWRATTACCGRRRTPRTRPCTCASCGTSRGR